MTDLYEPSQEYSQEYCQEVSRISSLLNTKSTGKKVLLTHNPNISSETRFAILGKIIKGENMEIEPSTNVVLQVDI